MDCLMYFCKLVKLVTGENLSGPNLLSK